MQRYQFLVQAKLRSERSFTLSDVAAILKLSEGTISKYVREYEKAQNEVIPRRGTIHDMGPTLTHKKIICYKCCKEGKTVEDVCRQAFKGNCCKVH